MQQSTESDTTERLNKGWDLVGPGDMPTKGSDVVTPSHTGGRSSVGRAARDREQQGPQGGRPPRDTQNPGERRPEHGAHTLRRGHTTRRANRRQGEDTDRSRSRGTGSQRAVGPAGWRRLRAPRSAPGWAGGAPSPEPQVPDPRGWWLIGGRYEGGRKGGVFSSL